MTKRRATPRDTGLVTLSTYDFGALAVYSTRYALGRATYAVADVCSMLRTHWSRIRAADRAAILRDIREHFEASERLGLTTAECDEREWRRVLEECKEEA